MSGLVHPVGQYVIELLELLNHWRNNEVDDEPDDGQHECHGDNDGQRTHAKSHLLLYKLHDRVEQVGKKPGYEKGEQHATQVVHHVEHGKYEQPDAGQADETVESDFLLHKF